MTGIMPALRFQARLSLGRENGLDDMVQTTQADKSVVLVVEDETLIRLDIVDQIESAGFEVLQASNADEAIAILEGNLNIHIVFTDVDMPGSMDGIKLARFVRGRWPPIKIVVTSGHFKVRDEDMPDGGLFFDKPYNPADVIQKLRELAARG
jgi:CheY-like chemotaxis protein